VGRVILGEMSAYCKILGFTAVSCAKTAEPIDLPFVLWTREEGKEGRAKEAQVQLYSPGGASMPSYQNYFEHLFY